MAVTVSYKSPYTSAPTLVQQHYTPQNQVIATVVAGLASDTVAIITHDFGLTAAELLLGYPSVQITRIADEGQQTSPWWESSENPNYTVLEKNATSAGVAVKVVINARPVN
jgi:hypothetical protein